MSSRQDERERLGRLAGTGEGSGGGLPLPDLFSAILNEMLDNGPASTEHLTEITAITLKGKSNNVTSTWGSWDAFADDLLKQMSSMEIITRNGDGLWHLDREGKFAAGVPLTIIPEGDGRKADGVVVWEQTDREAGNRRAFLEAEGRIQRSSLHPDRAGLRRVTPRRVEEIRESIAEYGDLRGYFPVLVNKQGDVIDGRHRLAIDRNWPTRTIDTESDDGKVLAAALAANVTHPWTKGEWDSLAAGRAMVKQALGEEIARGERIRAALLEQAGRDKPLSHNAIAKRLDLHPMVVNRECQSLITQCVISECPHRFTVTGKSAPGRKPAGPPKTTDAQKAGIRRDVHDHIWAAGEKPRWQDIAEKWGTSRTPVREAITAEWATWEAEQATAEEKPEFEVAPPAQADEPADGEHYADPYMPEPESVAEDSAPVCSHCCPAHCPTA